MAVITPPSGTTATAAATAAIPAKEQEEGHSLFVSCDHPILMISELEGLLRGSYSVCVCV